MKFFTILAWIFGVGASLLFMASVWATASYSDLEKTLDNLKGVEKQWPVWKSLFLAIICWAWIFSQ